MNPPRLIYVALLLYAAGFALLFGAWMAISYLPPKENGPALALWITATLGALVGHILTILTGDWSGKSTLPPAPPAQGGFFRLQLMAWIVLLAIGAAMLSGCAGLNVSWVATATYNTPATTAATLTPGALSAAVLPAKPASAP